MTAPRPSSPRLAGVVGAPVGHSLSPLIHTTWARRAGVPFHYIPIEAEGGDVGFKRVVEGLRTAGFRGVNVTLPFKEAALALAEDASAATAAIGAANMLTFTQDGVIADNSDADGFADGLRETGAAPLRSALVLGAGGSARAIVYALRSLIGVENVVIANRTRARAGALASSFGGVQAIDWADRDASAADADVVVNTTSIGMARDGASTDATPLRLDRARAGTLVCDIVYAPLETAFLREARARGLPTMDGLEMLMRQALPGFRAWAGGEGVVDQELRASCEAALSARGAL